MNKELIMKSDVLDILFENRNKNYGAYVLRKSYNNRLQKAFGMMMLAACGFAVFTFLPAKRGFETVPYVFDDPSFGHFKEPDIKQPEVKPKTTVPVQKDVSTGKLTSIIDIVNNTDPTDNLNIDLDKLVISSQTNISTNPGSPQVVDPPGSGGGEIPEPPKPPVIDKSIPLFNPEVMPEYPGGFGALRKFLERNLNNPKEMEEGEEVTVKIRFVVGINGKLQSFVTIQDGGEEFNKEVIRVLKKMPDWIPGRSNGENVLVYYTIPVKFVPAN